MCQVIATAGGYDVKRMTTFVPDLARGDAGAVEVVVGIVHLIDMEHGFQTTLIESLVVGYERKTGYLGLYLLPYVRKDRGVVSIGGTQTMHLTTPIFVIFRFGLDE